MAVLTIRLFGNPRILVNDNLIKVTSKKILALVAYLVIETRSVDLPSSEIINNDNKACSKEEIATVFWPGFDSKKAAMLLSRAVRNFNKASGREWICQDSHSISINPEMKIWVDVNQFKTQLRTWKREARDSNQSFAILSEIASLYQDEFLSGFALDESNTFEDWKVFQAETLRVELIEVLESLNQLCNVRRDLETAIVYAQRWLAVDPLNETAQRALMRNYAERGDIAAALRQYGECRSMLRQSLGVEPGQETRSLYEHIRSGTYPPVGTNTVSFGKKAIVSPETTQTGEKPKGTVTFLFTDIEGSTQLWEHYPEAMRKAHSRHELIIREVMADNGGYVYKMIGDAFQVAFSTAPAALRAALETQRLLTAELWRTPEPIKVRIALHTGVTEERGDDYVGPTLNRLARLLSAGHGGQILLNQTTFELVRESLPMDVTIQDLGEHVLKDLLLPEHIYQLKSPGIPFQFPPLRTADESVFQLPVSATPFIGREEELALIAELLQNADCRLITLVGVGGTGKTRLAIEAASCSRGFIDGVYFVDLASVATLDGIVMKITETMKISFYDPQRSGFSPVEAQIQLLNLLSGKTALLLLDNFEQLIPYSEIVNEILRVAQGIKILITSRERLNLPGEWVIDVGGLPYPSSLERERISEFAAVQLFVKNAERNGLRSISESDWLAIARICQHLEGIPLAVEMSASWTRIITCQEIEAELIRNMDFLELSLIGIPERHRTMRAVFDYSWNLLSTKERQVFAQLSVFKGCFTQEAALQVAAAPLHLLIALVDKSLIHKISSKRFEIHPVLRQYSVEKLTEQPALQKEALSRHATYYSSWLNYMFEKLKGREQLDSLNALRAEAQNLVHAFHWLLDQQEFLRLRQVVLAMILYYEMDDSRVQMQEMVWILGKMLSILSPLPGKDSFKESGASPELSYPDLYVLTLAALRHFTGRRSVKGWEESNFLLKESIKIAQQLPDNHAKFFTLLLDCIGNGNLNSQEIIDLCKQCITFFKGIGDVWATALAQLVAGDAETFGGISISGSETLYLESLEGFTRLGNEWGRAMCLTGLAEFNRKAGNLGKAYSMALQAQEIYELMNNQDRLLLNQSILGKITEEMGAFMEARRYYGANLSYLTQIGDDENQREYRERLAIIRSK